MQLASAAGRQAHGRRLGATTSSSRRALAGSSRPRVAVRRSAAAADTAQLPQPPEARCTPVEQAAQLLTHELTRMFTTGDVTASAYAPNIEFSDPISRFTDLTGYTLMIRALKALFQVTFDLHGDVEVTGPDTLAARWTMALKVWELPWQPTVLISGRSFYTVDPSSGLITRHRDVWDALDDTTNTFPSTEAVMLLVRQVMDLSQVPNLEAPEYKVLRVTKEYEVRRYAPFVVAEAPMGSGSSPAGGAGFNELAGYIFGNNADRTKMEMTVPVFSQPRSTSGTGSGSGSSMQFVIEKKMGGVDALPAPLDPRVTNKQLEGAFVAALRFGGLPLSFEVTGAEKRLREALLRDGLQPKAGYRLARYNEPWQPLPFRRNEVLIDLPDFTWT